jgi:hypothetical protein
MRVRHCAVSVPQAAWREALMGSGLLSAAMTAYTGAAAIAFMTSAGISILTAILAVTMFKGRKS